MSDAERVTIDVSDHVALVTLARPDKHNALDVAMFEAITPNSFIKAGTPPAIMYFGTADKLIAGATQYLARAKPLGLRAELWPAADQGHSFFNRAPWIQVTAQKTDEFLISLGYLKGEPTLKLPAGAVALVRQQE